MIRKIHCTNPQTGIVKWYNDSKGFGFITVQTGKHKGEDIFVHYTSIYGEGFKSLPEGSEVTLDILETERGLQATEVRKVK